jgi:hypothetical protein
MQRGKLNAAAPSSPTQSKSVAQSIAAAVTS